MKKLVFLSVMIIAIVALSSCNKSSASTDTGKKPSWKTEKVSTLNLIRPLDYNEGAVDAYGLPLQTHQWYLIDKSSDCYLLPIYIGSNPSFIEEMVRWKKGAVIDTIQADLMSSGKTFNGLRAVHTMEILCFYDDWHIKPSLSVAGQPTVVAKKKE